MGAGDGWQLVETPVCCIRRTRAHFQDSDGDGVGDLDGVAMRLDHLAWLGIDGIWLNPIHPSPNRDWGYDVGDYLDVAPELGGAGARPVDRRASRQGIRVILDLVPNHTSDRHPWFLDALTAAMPSIATGTCGRIPRRRRAAEQLAEHLRRSGVDVRCSSGQYYLHNFLPQQPDLNWWNDDVRASSMHPPVLVRRGVAGSGSTSHTRS